MRKGKTPSADLQKWPTEKQAPCINVSPLLQHIITMNEEIKRKNKLSEKGIRSAQHCSVIYLWSIFSKEKRTNLSMRLCTGKERTIRERTEALTVEKRERVDSLIE